MNSNHVPATIPKETAPHSTTSGAWATTSDPLADHTDSADKLKSVANRALVTSCEKFLSLDADAATGAPMIPPRKAKVDTGGEASHKPSKQRDTIDDIVHRLRNVEKRMTDFRAFIQAQKDQDRPLHKWNKYGDYQGLRTAVSKLEESTAKFKHGRIALDRLAASVARATHYSTSVSRAAVDILAMMNTKTGDYMNEMETSTLNEDAKTLANALITEEVGKLMEHSLSATEHVWCATDILRACKERCTYTRDWAWSAAATAMTAFIAAAVGIAASQVFSPSISGTSRSIFPHILDVVERTHAMTNLTSQIYDLKLQDIGQWYTDLSALAESHGARIDNLVEALGPPNAEGTYYGSMSKALLESDCNSRIQKVSADLGMQLARQQENLAQMRKDMNRMGIRLTQKVEGLEKKI
jgi:hypothetical protein